MPPALLAGGAERSPPPRWLKGPPLPSPPLPRPTNPPLNPHSKSLASAFRTHVVNSKDTDAASLAPVRAQPLSSTR